MNMPGFTAETSVNVDAGSHRIRGVSAVSSAQVTPQLLKPINSFPRALLCAQAWEDCRRNDVCEWYFAHCLESNGGGGDGGGGGGWPPRPNPKA